MGILETIRLIFRLQVFKFESKFALIESLVNTASGYGLSILIQLIMFPLFDIEIQLFDHLIIGLAFTVVSIGRNYIVRIAFDVYWQYKSYERLLGKNWKEKEVL